MKTVLRMAAGLACLVLAGCSSTPPARLYSLDDADPGTRAGCAAGAATVEVPPVVLPEYADRDQLVRRVGAHELALDDERHWAERPSLGIARRVAASLAGARHVCVETGDARGAALTVRIAFDRFEIGADGAAVMAGRWRITGAADDRTLAMHDFAQHGRPAATTDEQVASVADAVSTLGDEIAAALPQPGPASVR